MKGTVNRWSSKFGYGFIRGEDGNSYFLHASKLSEDFIGTSGRRNVDFGETVLFDVRDAARGPEAVNVRPVVDPEGTE